MHLQIVTPVDGHYEKITNTVALHAVKAGCGIQHQYFEFMFIALH
jgi:hypothetical protein